MNKQDVIIILIPTLLLVFAWIGFNIYHSVVTSTISTQEVIQIIPINPNFNMHVIEELKKRERVEPIFINPGESTTSATFITPSPKPIKFNIKSGTTSATTDNESITIK